MTSDDVADKERLDSPTVRSAMLETLQTNPRAYDRWSDQDEADLVDMIRQQVPWDQIASRFGRSQDAVRSRARRVAFREIFGPSLPDHPDYPREGEPWTTSEVTTLVELLTTASSWTEIAQRLQRQPKACQRRAEQVALDRLVSTTAP